MTRIKILKKIISVLERLIILRLKLLIKLELNPEKRKRCVRELIITIAKQENINPQLALKVAECESGYNPYAVNVNTDGSRDRGLYQWNDKYHPEITDKMAFDPEIATREFCRAVKSGHLYWWNASRPCWSK